jgi:hypothetical protein
MGKRKQIDELSTNPYTAKERKRLCSRPPERVEYERRRKNDLVAQKRAIQELCATLAYQAASPDQRNQLTETCKSDVTAKR